MDDFFLYLKLKEKFGSGLVGSCSGSFLPAVIDRRWDREREASRIDSPDSLNWQLALMSILILMRGSQISQFISCMTPPTPHPSKWTWLFYLFHLKNSFTLSFLFRPVHWEKLGVQGLPHATVIIMECLPHHKVPPPHHEDLSVPLGQIGGLLANTLPQFTDLPPNQSWFVPPPPHSYLLFNFFFLIYFLFFPLDCQSILF